MSLAGTKLNSTKEHLVLSTVPIHATFQSNGLILITLTMYMCMLCSRMQEATQGSVRRFSFIPDK